MKKETKNIVKLPKCEARKKKQMRLWNGNGQWIKVVQAPKKDENNNIG